MTNKEESEEDVIRHALREELDRLLPPEQVSYGEPMDRHCSFRTGGPADALVCVHTPEELIDLLALLREEGEPCFLLGKGTNLLVGDGGYRGVIVTAVEPGRSGSSSLTRIRAEGNRLTVGAGATLRAAALAARDSGLAGLEFAAGIPGTVGGGLVMNAGAYGGEMKDVVRSVRLLLPDGEVRVCPGQEMAFGYRTSLLRRVPAVVLEAELELADGDPAAIGARIEALDRQRREKQPLEYPSAGSTFKRPEGFFAGKLIMDAGLRGYGIGGAQVSEKHCGFIINRGGATSAQIRQLIEAVQERVYADSGVRLEREVIYLGDF